MINLTVVSFMAILSVSFSILLSGICISCCIVSIKRYQEHKNHVGTEKTEIKQESETSGKEVIAERSATDETIKVFAKRKHNTDDKEQEINR